MKNPAPFALALWFSVVTLAFGQRPVPPSKPQSQPSQAGVVRLSSTLVQVDAVVTDRKGVHVTDLKPEDFVILEDGRPQKITQFSYISTQPSSTPLSAAAAAPPADKSGLMVPPVRWRPGQVTRTIALVVDDLGLSFASTAHVRQALKKFVDEQMQPGDLVAVIRTGAGMGALQQFTSDRRQVYAAIKRVRWNPRGRGGISAFAPIGAEPPETTRAGAGLPGVSSTDADAGNPGQELDRFREELFSVGTLGAINFIVRGLRELPGRKSVVLFSDGFRLYHRRRDNSRVLESLRRLIDLANRASVVIYTIDPRGLPTLGLMAEDRIPTRPDQLVARLSERRDRFEGTQEGLVYLGRQTGGLSIRNTNDISGGLSRVLDDQQGYYLLGYIPDESTFTRDGNRPRFHKVTVKVNRPGWRVRSRTGFYGIPDQAAHPARRTPAAQLFAALTSPFASGDVGLRLTSLFFNQPRQGSFVRSLLHIEARDLSFTDQADGGHTAVFDVLAITFNERGRVVDQAHRRLTLRTGSEMYQEVRQRGLVYTLDLPVKKAGAYQLRIAVRDSGSGRVGSANQFIEVPDIGKKRLAVSGIAVSGSEPTVAPRLSAGGVAPSPAEQAASTPEDEVGDSHPPQATPAMRVFRQSAWLDYGFMIYNAKLDRATHRPQLQWRVRLFRDSQQVFARAAKPVDPGQQTDLKRLLVGGRLQLGTEMEPGHYFLQIIVTDKLAKKKYRTAIQWIDFDVVK